MAELIYRDEKSENREAFQITFEIPNDLTINEFKIMCIRMASSIGYSPKSIKKAFGDESEVIGSDEKRQMLLDSLGIKTNEINELTGSVEG